MGDTMPHMSAAPLTACIVLLVFSVFGVLSDSSALPGRSPLLVNGCCTDKCLIRGVEVDLLAIIPERLEALRCSPTLVIFRKGFEVRVGWSTMAHRKLLNRPVLSLHHPAKIVQELRYQTAFAEHERILMPFS